MTLAIKGACSKIFKRTEMVTFQTNISSKILKMANLYLFQEKTILMLFIVS